MKSSIEILADKTQISINRLEFAHENNCIIRPSEALEAMEEYLNQFKSKNTIDPDHENFYHNVDLTKRE